MSDKKQDAEDLNELFKDELLPEGNSGVFFVNIEDKNELYQLYMPFVNGGGLFIRTTKFYRLGDEVFLLIKLLDEADKYPLAGEVVWITPTAAQGGKASGIGIRFLGDEGQEIRNKIETYLAGALQSDRETETL